MTRRAGNLEGLAEIHRQASVRRIGIIPPRYWDPWEAPAARRYPRRYEVAATIERRTSSPSAAPADFSAALLTPTQRPPPPTSIVLPVNAASLSVPATRI